MCRVVCVLHCQVHVLNLVYELTEEETCLPKHVGVVEDHIFSMFVTCSWMVLTLKSLN